MAASRGHTEVVKAIVQRGELVDAKTNVRTKQNIDPNQNYQSLFNYNEFRKDSLRFT